MKSLAIGLVSGAALASSISSGSLAQDARELPPLGPDDLMFSVENMDLSVDPADDFYRFAAGGWLATVKRPEDLAAYGFSVVQQERIKATMMALLPQTAEQALTAPKGSVTQIVGDFYTAYMDTERRDARGIEPLRDELDRIAAISSLDDLARYAAHSQTFVESLLFAIAPTGDLVDQTRYAIYAGAGTFGLETERDVYRSADDAPRRVAYRTYVEDMLKVAGYEADVAARMADTILAIETELDAAKLTDAERGDFRKVYNPMSFDEYQTQIPNIDLRLYMEELGFDIPDQIILTEPRYYPVLSKMLDERPLEDWKDYAAFLLLRHFSGVLTTAFDEPERALRQAFTGVATLRPREERALGMLKEHLGHPVSQVFVEATFDEATRDSVTELIVWILDVFKDRIPTRDWLSDPTKSEALAKLNAFKYPVGYPDKWIDYSGVDIVRDDPVANLMAISEFGKNLIMSRLGGPVIQDPFSGLSTLPIAMNAAYTVTVNGFEITAAIAQPPAYQVDAGPAVRFCGFGGIIGHEATHGFDSGGRQFDAQANLRDWWTEADNAAFLAEAQKLINQANATEIAPGHFGNGEFWVKENMADVGGITLAHAALMSYLAEHPEENVAIDGFTQEQRCFIAWTQLWAELATEEFLINVAESGNHPPNSYRTTAPLQHVDAFYEAFDIKEGDPVWLPPEQRVHAW
ncbi:MAG TPA: M13 family metallopeptidase [Geminicoccaceae bacterium]|nr:M13 family metallopeptidase [Geminicoccaceae bacterium]